MRTTMFTLLSLLSIACGPKKPPEDPATSGETSPSTEAPKDGTEETKWDSSSTTPTSRPASTGTTAPASAPGRRHDEYDKESVEVQMKKAARQVKEHCGGTKDDTGKATGPWGKGRVQVVLGRNGHSKGVTVPSPYDGTPVGKCITNAFTNLMFMPWAGQDATIDWEFEVVAPPPPPAPEKPEKPKK